MPNQFVLTTALSGFVSKQLSDMQGNTGLPRVALLRAPPLPARDIKKRYDGTQARRGEDVTGRAPEQLCLFLPCILEIILIVSSEDRKRLSSVRQRLGLPPWKVLFPPLCLLEAVFRFPIKAGPLFPSIG